MDLRMSLDICCILICACKVEQGFSMKHVVFVWNSFGVVRRTVYFSFYGWKSGRCSDSRSLGINDVSW